MIFKRRERLFFGKEEDIFFFNKEGKDIFVLERYEIGGGKVMGGVWGKWKGGIGKMSVRNGIKELK